jgi:hypothetical protein
VTTARLPIGTARQRYTHFQNIYCIGCTFIASRTVDVFATNRKRLVAVVQLLPS